MIVPMKEVTVVCTAADAEKTLSVLRGLGVLHVEHQKKPEGKDVSSLLDDIALVSDGLNVLSEKEFLGQPCREPHRVPADWRAIARHIVESSKRLDQLKEYSHHLRGRIMQAKPWGDFDPADIQALAQKNIFIRLYEIPEKELGLLPKEAIVRIISKQGGVARVAIVARQALEVSFKEVFLPRMSLTQMGQRLMEDKMAMKNILSEIYKWTCYRQSFINIRGALEKELEFHEALAGMGQAGALVYLRGYAPFDTEPLLLEASQKEKWGLLITDPADDENIPTLVRNPRWISWIQPLLKLLEILPGYKELDISPMFLIFFSLFFGIIIGDAAYGLIYLLVTLLAQRKFGVKVQDKRIFPLLYLLSSCAIVWGLLTGTFFGQAWLAHFGVGGLVPILNDPIFLQGMCFFIGATHLSLGHLWRFAIQFPSQPAWAEIGWISILWAAFMLAKMLLLGAVFPDWGKYLIIGGISLVVLFSNPRRNVFARIGAGLGAIALSLMNAFGDIVSYVRLFAVGLAGVAISDAFNAMASGAAGSGVIGIVGAGFILVAGHLLNIVLSPMSVLVHGVRLNVLEFSGHAGVTWSGMPYKPLRT